MFHSSRFSHSFRFSATLIVVSLFACSLTVAAQKPDRSPSDTVREFYKAMREKRFREGFDMSIFAPAIDGLKPQEFEDLRPDFEVMAAAAPENVEITGEQISGDEATVFMKIPKEDDPTQIKIEPVLLIRAGGVWIIGDKENQQVVKKAGNKFFFEARITAHQGDVVEMMGRINVAELIYQQQHDGVFADMPTLIAAGLVPKDLEGTASTGYRFHLALGKDAKTYSAGAEPAEYGRTGRLSYFMDQAGLRNGDVKGKPLPTPPAVP
jgi:hypothetical protein